MSALKIKDVQGNWIEVPMIKGDKGDKGEQGDTYELTEQDKQDIADLIEVPESFEIHICSSAEYDSTTGVPTIQNPDEKTFYLVPSADGTSPDLFVEWAYVNNAWEMFGSASIDLSNYVTNTDYATTNVGGIIRVGSGLKIGGDGQRLFTDTANSSDIKTGTQSYKPLSPYNQHESTFYGLAKASGDSTQSASSNAVGTYTDEAKASIQNMLGVPSVDDIPDVPVEDVQINGTSIVNNGVANIPIATNTLGAVYVSSNVGSTGLNIDQYGVISVYPSITSFTKAGANVKLPIVPSNQHESTFYGLAKAAGDTTQSQSSNTVGTYTPQAKGAIQSMLGVDALIAPTETNPFTDAHAIGDLFIINGTLYRAKTAIAVGDVLDDGVNAEAVNVDDVLGNYVKNTDYATANDYGVVKIKTGTSGGLQVGNGLLSIYSAGSSHIKVANNTNIPITPAYQHESVFYGLAKASGDTTQSQSDNAVGTYTDDAKSSIQTMLGLSDVVRNTDYCTDNTSGVARTNSSFGVTATSTGNLRVSAAASNHVKAGVDGYKPIVPIRQHESVFYGLTKAAGVDMASSSNAVGTYTDEAKTAIKQMLGVVDSYDSLVVNVSGTDPVITGSPSYRYNCGEVASLTVTPPSSGTIDIIFTSGTTPTVLDLPNTVKMPSWWIGVEANTTYEMCITDGVYCGVMSWDA